MGEADVKDVKQMFSLLNPDSAVNYTVSKCNTNFGLMSFLLCLEGNKNRYAASKCCTYSGLYFQNFLLMQNQPFETFTCLFKRNSQTQGQMDWFVWNVQHNTADLNSTNNHEWAVELITALPKWKASFLHIYITLSNDHLQTIVENNKWVNEGIGNYNLHQKTELTMV